MTDEVNDNAMLEETDSLKPKVYVAGPDAVDITPEKNSGVLKEILRPGGGEDHPLKGDTVYVHYVGTLLSDGTKFDSSRDRDEKFEFTLGEGAVIKAWDLGVATMLRGELAVLQCSAEYAYGKKGSLPSIPPDAALVFEVELFDWKGEDVSMEKDGSILKSVLKESESYKQPHEQSTCLVHVTVRHHGLVVQDVDISFTVGEVFDGAVVPGVELAVQQLKLHEKAKFLIKSKHAYGSEGNAKYNIPANADLEYEIELKDIVEPKQAWQLDVPEKFAESELSKTRGNELFKNGHYAVALKYYKRISEMVLTEPSLEGELVAKRVELLLACHNNSAQCHLKLNVLIEAIASCDEVLTLDSKNEKGLFRRGTANLKLENYEAAATDFRKVLAVDPTSASAKSQLLLATNEIKKIREHDKKTYGGMFEKFAEEDAKKKKANAPISVWKKDTGEDISQVEHHGVEGDHDNQSTEPTIET